MKISMGWPIFLSLLLPSLIHIFQLLGKVSCKEVMARFWLRCRKRHKIASDYILNDKFLVNNGDCLDRLFWSQIIFYFLNKKI